jgi:hypothetical protein
MSRYMVLSNESITSLVEDISTKFCSSKSESSLQIAPSLAIAHAR